MSSGMGASLARLAQLVVGRFRSLWLGRIKDRERDGAKHDIFASYVAPVRRPKEPPYASLRQ